MVSSGVNVPAIVVATAGGLVIIGVLIWWMLLNLRNKKHNATLLEEIYKQIPKSTMVTLAPSARRQFAFLAIWCVLLELVMLGMSIGSDVQATGTVSGSTAVIFGIVTIIFVFFIIRYLRYAITGKIKFSELNVHGRFDYYRKTKMANAPAPAIKQ